MLDKYSKPYLPFGHSTCSKPGDVRCFSPPNPESADVFVFIRQYHYNTTYYRWLASFVEFTSLLDSGHFFVQACFFPFPKTGLSKGVSHGVSSRPNLWIFPLCVPRLSKRCPDALGTLSGHLFGTLEPGAESPHLAHPRFRGHPVGHFPGHFGPERLLWLVGAFPMYDPDSQSCLLGFCCWLLERVSYSVSRCTDL